MTGQPSVLSRLSTQLETATGELADAYDAEAEAENAYLAAYQTAWALETEAKSPATIRAKNCDNDPTVCELKQEWNRAVAARKRAWAFVDALNHRLMAAMSHQRFVREQTGG